MESSMLQQLAVATLGIGEKQKQKVIWVWMSRETWSAQERRFWVSVNSSMLALGSLSHRLLWSSLDVQNVIIQILNSKYSYNMLYHIVWTSCTRTVNLNTLMMSLFSTDKLLLLFVCCHQSSAVILWKLTAEYYDRTLCFGLMVVRSPGLSWLLSQRPLTYSDWPQSHTSGEGRGHTLPTATAHGMLGALSKSPPTLPGNGHCWCIYSPWAQASSLS